MSNVHRICPACGKDTPLDARHCPHCGHDTQAGLPVQAGSQLPMVVGKAALPVLVGVGTLAARMGWRLLRGRLAALGTQSPAPVQPRTESSARPPARVTPAEVAPRARRSIRIRSSWAVGDARGIWQQGATEHIIEIDE
jgi:hypothetical protein